MWIFHRDKYGFTPRNGGFIKHGNGVQKLKSPQATIGFSDEKQVLNSIGKVYCHKRGWTNKHGGVGPNQKKGSNSTKRRVCVKIGWPTAIHAAVMQISSTFMIFVRNHLFRIQPIPCSRKVCIYIFFSFSLQGAGQSRRISMYWTWFFFQCFPMFFLSINLCWLEFPRRTWSTLMMLRFELAPGNCNTLLVLRALLSPGTNGRIMPFEATGRHWFCACMYVCIFGFFIYLPLHLNIYLK